MLKFFLLVAVSAKLLTLATAYVTGESTADTYYNNLLKTMNEGLYSQEDTEIADPRERFYKANDVLTGCCLYNLIRTHPGENQVTSILPLMFWLGQIALFAEDPTRTEILNLLNLKDDDEIRVVVPEVAAKFNSNNTNDVTVSLRTMVMADNKNQFNDEFANQFYTFFQGETKNLDYSDTALVANKVNEWMSQANSNNGNIFLTSDQVYDDTGIIFVSDNQLTVYWGNDFKMQKGKMMDFYVETDVSVQTEGCTGTGYANIYEIQNINSLFVSISLKGGFHLHILLPQGKSSLEDIVVKMRKSNEMESALENGKRVFVTMSVPLLQDLYGHEDYYDGLKLVMQLPETYESDFNGIRKAFVIENPTAVSRMFHQMHLRFGDGENSGDVVTNDDGTEEMNIDINRPFLGYVTCADGAIVYAFIYRKPHAE